MSVHIHIWRLMVNRWELLFGDFFQLFLCWDSMCPYRDEKLTKNDSRLLESRTHFYVENVIYDPRVSPIFHGWHHCCFRYCLYCVVLCAFTVPRVRFGVCAFKVFVLNFRCNVFVFLCIFLPTHGKLYLDNWTNIKFSKTDRVTFL